MLRWRVALVLSALAIALFIGGIGLGSIITRGRWGTGMMGLRSPGWGMMGGRWQSDRQSGIVCPHLEDTRW